MDSQKPPSDFALFASLAFFSLMGLGLVGLGIATMGEESESIWVIIFGSVMVLGTASIAPLAFKGAEKQRAAHEKLSNKQTKKDEGTTYQATNTGFDDFLSGLGSLVAIVIVVIIGFFVLRGGWNFVNDKFGPKDYKAFFYYDPSDLNKYWKADVSSIEDCRDWVDVQVSRDFDGYYDYECGVNCEYGVDYNGYTCDKTLE
jgi:hypothetical protein